MPTLTIVFGGLCMFVEKKNGPDPGLYVLMPRADDEAHDPPHCPMVLAPSRATGNVRIWSFKDRVESLGTTQPSSPVQLDSTHFLRMSRYARRAVNPSYFQGAPSGCLIARVWLPLGTAVTPIPPFGRARVPSNGGHVSVDVTGLASVEVEVREPLVIGGYEVNRMNDGSYHIALVNIPYSHLDGKRRDARVNARMTHVPAYYGLLDGMCGDDHTHHHGPEIFQDEDYTPTNNPAGDVPCRVPTEPTEVPGVMPGLKSAASLTVTAGFHIDPVNCTIGSGCEDIGAC